MSTKSIFFAILLICSLPISKNIKCSEPSDHYSSHHLVDNYFDGLSHEDKYFFLEAEKQLKNGKFDTRGMLLYGPYEEGKNEMLEALEGSSDCHILKVKASELVNHYQGSGAHAIKTLFDRAKILKTNKGVIILVERLQNLSPNTTESASCGNLALENENTLSQLRCEYDRCQNNKYPILVVATCDNLLNVDKGTRDRLRCINFPYPSNMHNSEISEHELLNYAQSVTESIRKKIKNKKCHSKAIKRKN